MAKLDKDVYDGKREWAAKRMSQNAENENLTPEQHEYLEDLCTFRHELHTNWDEAFNPESSLYRYFSDQLGEWSEMTERCTLYLDGKRLFGKAPFYLCDYPNSDDLDDDPDAYDEACEIFQDINDQIERFLYNIDKTYGTNYCPSGVSRFY